MPYVLLCAVGYHSNSRTSCDQIVSECYAAGKPEMTCVVTSQHAAYNVSVKTTARTAQVAWFPAFDSGLRQHYIVWLVHKQPAYRKK